MAKDPGFIFYPGDYLRDTQCLSSNAQVAYDRVICEHMRNICISEQQLNFFTKRLTEDEREELYMVLTKKDGGFQIEWVADSIEKRRAYSESRRKNRISKPKQPVNKISSTYDKHMEDENENEYESKNVKEIVWPFKSKEFLALWNNWKIFKKEEFRFNYKSIQSEQASLTGLSNLSKQNEIVAKEIILYSMSNGYRGFFELKQQKNGQQGFSEERTRSAINKYFGSTAK